MRRVTVVSNVRGRVARPCAAGFCKDGWPILAPLVLARVGLLTFVSPRARVAQPN
jgi:hypothetical protein